MRIGRFRLFNTIVEALISRAIAVSGIGVLYGNSLLEGKQPRCSYKMRGLAHVYSSPKAPHAKRGYIGIMEKKMETTIILHPKT